MTDPTRTDELAALRAKLEATERQLRRQEMFTRSVLRASLEGFHIVGTDGMIRDCNEAFAEGLGYARDELLTMPIYAIDRRPREEIGAVIQQVLDRSKLRFAAQHHHRDGHAIDVEVSAHLVELDGDRFFACFSHAITEQLARERALRTSEETLREVMTAQEAMIRELSTPLIPIEAGVLVAPLIGRIDGARAAALLERLLSTIVERRATTAILDITGVPVVDTEVAAALVQAAQAVQLLGARAVLTGVRPEVASTIVDLGLDLRGLVTLDSLQTGLAWARARARR